ncbi:MAG: 3-isopropylmalate dehydrogenase, partial [Propionibacteriaceae bacterium]|nr:3-isopropylmalate dehydrogenase [Propionibacteriaceae bacterium]
MIAVIGGDGIGPEVTAVAVQALDALGLGFHYTYYDLGAGHWLKTGEVLEDATLAKLAAADAILLGAVGAAPGSAAVPSGLLERGLLLKLRFAFDHAVNLRPSHLYPGVPVPLAQVPSEVDFVVVREGTEGLYCGNGGVIREGTGQEIATEVSVNTAYGVSRVVRYAFALAARRRGRLTLVHKHNVLVNAGGLWRRLTAEIGAEFPDVETDYLHVDAATIALLTDPGRFDVLVTDNLFGDILTDEAAAVTGGIGLAASANLNVDGPYPSMFEPVHGSAPDIAGLGVADPRAAVLSAALLLDHLGYEAEAARVQAAVAWDIAAAGS